MGVSIPQSGFGAFERHLVWIEKAMFTVFQSLSRDSGRLNEREHHCRSHRGGNVSIPQSGFGAFEPSAITGTYSFSVGVSIPQSGFGAFEPRTPASTAASIIPSFNPSVGIRGV